MSWVNLSSNNSESANSGEKSYKEVANNAFASPTNLSSRKVGNRTPSKDAGESKASFSHTSSSSSRGAPTKTQSTAEAEAFHQMFSSTNVQVPKKPKSSGDLGEGLKSLSQRATRQYYGARAATNNNNNLSSVAAEASEYGSSSTSTGKESFSIGSADRRTNDLDLAHNDNSFHVIGGLIVEFFHSKQKAGNDDLRLTPQDIAQLDRLAPPRVRASFVEAVRYRFKAAPMDSTRSVHMLARQCHDLGLDAEGLYNPLLVAAEAEIVIPVPKADNAKSTGSSGVSYASSEADAQSATTPSGTSYGQPKQDASDPPAGFGDASVGTRLTKYGIEVPAVSSGSQSSTASGIHSSAASATSNSGVEAFGYAGYQPSANSVQGTVTSSLTKFGIEIPKYDSSSSSVASALSNGKKPSEQVVSAHSGSGVSQRSHASGSNHTHHSSMSHHSNQSKAASQQHQPLVENVSAVPSTMSGLVTTNSDPAVHSIFCGSDDGSSVLRQDNSRDFGGLAKQQLLAELREATNLMAESKTQEAAQFWRDHVNELEARLKALEAGEDVSTSSGPEKPLQTKSAVSETQQSTTLADTFIDETEPEVQPARSNSPNNQYVPPSQDGSQAGDDMQNAIEMGSTTRKPLAIDPSLEGVPMVDVVAPADLPGGYHFEAEIEGRRFLATVPVGGVQKGETFSCYMRDLEKVGSDIPVGRWRDGLFDCFKFGCCHGVICNAIFCPLVMLGQIMSRVGFDFMGRPSLDNSVNSPSTLCTIMSFWVFVNFVLFGAYNLKWSQGMELSIADLGAFAFVNAAYILFIVYLTSATRGSLREKYYIRESRFHDLEDCCCATFCLPCSICQMARHTADYDEYEAVLCNSTGLPDVYETTKHAEDMSPTNSYVV